MSAARQPDAQDQAATAAAKHGYERSWGAFLAAICDESGWPGDGVDIRRVQAAGGPGSAMSERVPSQGGFLVPERLLTQVENLMADAIIRPRSTPVPMDSLRVPVPVLSNYTESGSNQALGGLEFSMIAEAAPYVPTAPSFESLNLEARKAGAYLQFVPNELIDDGTPFTDVFLPQIVARGLAWFTDDLCIGNGSGVGEPQSLVNAPAALTVTRSTSSSVVLADILNMLKKLHPASKTKATWVIADEVFGQLLDLFVNVGSATTDIAPPPNWLEFDSRAGCWRLLGLECCPHDHLPALGSTGDVILADLRQYLFGSRGEMTVERAAKGAGWVTNTSDFRFRYRWDARLWPQSTFTTAAGQVVSPLVILN